VQKEFPKKFARVSRDRIVLSTVVSEVWGSPGRLVRIGESVWEGWIEKRLSRENLTVYIHLRKPLPRSSVHVPLGDSKSGDQPPQYLEKEKRPWYKWF